MVESLKVKQARESFKQYLSESIKDKTAILMGIDKNIYLAGVVGIVLEVTKGLVPLFIGRSAVELANTINTSYSCLLPCDFLTLTLSLLLYDDIDR